jgi:TetR/AcrR family transcriptional regulator, acrAB operon repressor
VRRTKQQSEQTRQQILAAARSEFARRGVTRTSLEHVAAAAGVTRGAIYWHFDNKTDLFHAMREQVSLPLFDRTSFALLSASDEDPLAAVEAFLRSLIDTIAGDKTTLRTFQIMAFKCEYVDEFAAELRRQMRRCQELVGQLTGVYERARRAGVLRPGLAPAVAAMDTCVFVNGLVRLFLVDGAGSFIRPHAGNLIGAHVASRRAAASVRAARATGRQRVARGAAARLP